MQTLARRAALVLAREQKLTLTKTVVPPNGGGPVTVRKTTRELLKELAKLGVI